MEFGFSRLNTRNSVTAEPVACGCALKNASLVAGGQHDGFPIGDELRLVEAAHVEEQLQVHVHDARDIFGTLDVAGHPVEGIGDAA